MSKGKGIDYDDKIVITNPSLGDFTCEWDGIPYTIKKGESKEFIRHIGLFVAKHLCDRIMLDSGVQRPNDQVSRIKYMNMIVSVSQLNYKLVDGRVISDDLSRLSVGAEMVSQMKLRAAIAKKNITKNVLPEDAEKKAEERANAEVKDEEVGEKDETSTAPDDEKFDGLDDSEDKPINEAGVVIPREELMKLNLPTLIMMAKAAGHEVKDDATKGPLADLLSAPTDDGVVLDEDAE